MKKIPFLPPDAPSRPLFLAPMEDVTDPAFRALCRRFGADMLYTEFVSADALVRSVPSTERKLTLSDAERPVAIQLYGRDPEAMAEAARRAEAAHPDVIDLNFGCPVKKVAGKGAGAGLLRNVPLMLDITRAVVGAVSTPVTVKTRLGWDASSVIIADLALRLQDCGIAALTIHGRTRAQMYTGSADWSPIAEVAADPRITIPVIGNGDITSPEEAAHAFEAFGVDAVMIGRASIGRPWLFAAIRAYLDGKPYTPPTPGEQVAILRDLIDANIAWCGDEFRGILHSRRHLATTPVFKGIPDFKPLRIAMLRAATRADLFDLLDQALSRIP